MADGSFGFATARPHAMPDCVAELVNKAIL
jgi:hypothetical protein